MTSHPTRISHHETQRGVTLLTVLVIIPILLTLTIISVDLMRWQALRSQAQMEADRIAFLGASSLPNIRHAYETVSRELENLNTLHADSEFDVNGIKIYNNSTLDVRLAGKVNSVFDMFVGSTAFMVKARSVVRIVPGDYILIISDNSSLRPGLHLDSERNRVIPEPAWGSLPASGYFWQATPPPSHGISEDSSHWNWTEDWYGAYPRWATQGCYSPPLLAIKRAGLSIVDSLSAFKENRVGLFFTPGSGNQDTGYSVSKYLDDAVHGSISYPASPARHSSSASWPVDDYQVETGLSHDACIMFSEPTVSGNTDYVLPSVPGILGPANNLDIGCKAPISDFIPGEIHDPFNRIDKCYLEHNIDLRKAIFWRLAGAPQPNNTRGVDLKSSLNAATIELLKARFSDPPYPRGNLNASSAKAIILIVDSLNHFEEVQDSLMVAKRLDIQVNVIVYAHKFLKDPGLLSSRYEKWVEHIKQLGLAGHTRLFLAKTESELSLQIVPAVISGFKRVSLSK